MTTGEPIISISSDLTTGRVASCVAVFAVPIIGCAAFSGVSPFPLPAAVAIVPAAALLHVVALHMARLGRLGTVAHFPVIVSAAAILGRLCGSGAAAWGAAVASLLLAVGTLYVSFPWRLTSIVSSSALVWWFAHNPGATATFESGGATTTWVLAGAIIAAAAVWCGARSSWAAFWATSTAVLLLLGHVSLAIRVVLAALLGLVVLARTSSVRSLRVATVATVVGLALGAARIGYDIAVPHRDLPFLVDIGVRSTIAEAAMLVLRRDVELKGGAPFWAVLALLSALGYRMLETASARRRAGPVTLELAPGSGPPTANDLLRAELARIDLFEPSTVPGGAVTDAIAQFGEAEPKSDSLKLVAATARLSASLRIASGIKVKCSYRTATSGAEVTIYLAGATTGEPIASTTFTAENEADLARRAAAYVACHAWSQWSDIPGWACWPRLSFEAFADLQSLPAMGATSSDLERVVNAAPGAAVARFRLAGAYDVEGEHLKALREHLIVRIDHPTLLAARYRLAVSLGLVAGDLPKNWWSVAVREYQLIVADILNRHHFVHRASWPKLKGPKGMNDALRLGGLPAGAESSVRSALLDIADAELRMLIWMVGYPALAARAVRLSRERGSVLRLMRSPQNRARLLGTYRSALVVNDLRRALADPVSPDTARIDVLRQQIDRLAAAVPDDDGLMYNAACFYALLARRCCSLRRLADRSEPGRRDWVEGLDLAGKAIVLLERAWRLPGGNDQGSPWLLRDPDLSAIREHPRFKALLHEQQRLPR